MPYDSFLTQGTLLYVKISGSYTQIPGATEIDFGGGKKPEIDDTSLADTVEKYKMGLPNYGDLNFTLKYDPSETTHVYLKTSFDNAASPEEEFRVNLQDQATTQAELVGPISTWGPVSIKKSALGMLPIKVRLNASPVLS